MGMPHVPPVVCRVREVALLLVVAQWAQVVAHMCALQLLLVLPPFLGSCQIAQIMREGHSCQGCVDV
jgi:hypothetical protein